MAIEFLYLAPEQVESVREQILSVYAAAFAIPPYHEDEESVERFGHTLRQHVRRQDFRCCIARESTDGSVLGFGYGYTSRPGQWWHNNVARALSRRDVTTWLDGAFEIVDLAVLPAAQGHGIGGRLHDELLEGLPHHSAVLSTHQSETVAMQLYRKRGWVPLLRDFFFPGSSYLMTIMRLDLSKRGTPHL